LGIPIFTRGDTNILMLKQRSRFRNLLHGAAMWAYYAQCDGCLAVGTRNAELYRHHGVPDRKIFQVPFAVDNAHFMAQADAGRLQAVALKAEIKLRPELPVLLFASKFTQRKHPLDVLRAKAALQREGTECSVLLIGAGEEDQALRQYCSEQALRDVHFLGFLNQSELPRYYALADVFILPSENEPWGLIINEVMCAGVAVVATEEVGAVVDLVRPGENGMLYPVRDVEALTSILRDLIRDLDLCRHMGQRSREIIADWSYEQCVEGVRSALQTVS
jgi:glycosyltransferase involved in cell wall biosynthesis